MNKAILVGRLTADPNYRKTQSGISQCSFSLAVDRPYSGQNGERQTDFINCVIWRQQADFVHNYINKGSLVALEGSIQTRDYTDQSGQKRYVTEVVVDRIRSLESRAQVEARRNSQGQYNNNYNQGSPAGFNQTPNYNSSYNSNMNQAHPQAQNTTTNTSSQPFEDFTSDFDISDNDLPF